MFYLNFYWKWSIKTNNIVMVKCLLDECMNYINSNGQTPLHLAVIYNNIYVIKLLLEYHHI